MHSTFHQQLFTVCEQISPYLSGRSAEPDEMMLCYNSCRHQNSDGEKRNRPAFFTRLYAQLQSEHPNAGHSYWLSRCWDLVTWQPLYIAFISIYRFNTLPDFQAFAQSQTGSLVAGFCFSTSAHQHGGVIDLVQQAALQLDGLFEAYRIQLDQHYRCRPGFVKQRLADAVIHCCLRLKQFAPELTLDEVKNSAILWLHAFQLPTVQSQKITELNHELTYFRKSCCLVYKTEHGTLCENCPRRRIVAAKRSNQSYVSTESD